ncbi:MAG: CvpA family protein [Rikenellaceae bacterium]
MNYIDLIVCLTLIVAIYNGWRQGVIVQVCSILGFLCGLWLAARYGAAVGAWLSVDDAYASAAGFMVVIVAVLIVVSILSHMVKKLFRFVGLGSLDVILGVALSVGKYALILSVVFGAFDYFNKEVEIVSAQTTSNSKLYRPIISISDNIFPALDWTQKQISSGLEKI